MKKKSGKKILKKIILIIVFILIIILSVIGIKALIKNKYRKILEKNNVHNYEVIQSVDGVQEQVAYVRDNVLIVDDGENVIWLSKKENKSIVVNTLRKTAFITKEENVKISGLNDSYITEYFDNSDYKFKYLGKENNYYLLEFTNKETALTTVLYLNIKTNIIDKQIVRNAVAETVIEYKVKINSVSTEEIKEPDLTDYYIFEQ